ncbi:hypothetical protein AGABI1DRAFT_107397 [Agaricus bisporus var. burnettii JB137-S8]|uniref:Nephrocystin 3-like N-terminal domain-containing protein n=1 Tax=Agaricus bisporus var. burnettii (strain JB137-S8 / ATCC MYA-4627 / FGSC 10392) TaxID=597362 RepID=K5X7L6_AGABU|nr:uncharacterized protein AGABI1DRAFT_107397 [Agaricus bisporus var. burnettii JB137-S8]EKM78977.1 hypothetical protein AGABI1DRAFT_107397 [Agaricus bisporus var. burnettii JB137-S8]
MKDNWTEIKDYKTTDCGWTARSDKGSDKGNVGTRVSLIARITAWFNSEQLQELLLWITGPAGVGKSAIVQTFAEYLVESQLLGASVFCSRPNKRNNPHRIFNTIAYQLAIRITAYREFLVERLSLDPQLLNRDMTTQFNAFIVEPFVEKKIGVGGKKWGILLDGLDELDGEDAQCEIIQLISTFTLEHRDAPLVWIIASRPESHISNTFDDDAVRRSCWSECIPIDSTEACEDVDRFLRSSFKTVQKKYRHSVSSDWPSESDFLKLTAASSGLFIYAQVVMEFIRDPHHADPVSRLEVLLRVIDRFNVVPTNENPFVHLDALYSEILSSIPSTLWPTTKRLLGAAIYGEEIKLGRYNSKMRPNMLSLRGMSILFGVPRNSVYASLDKSRSTLKIPDWKVAHKKPLTFLHASFSDYLKDSSRSGDFYIGIAEDVKEDVGLRLLEIWGKCSEDDISMVSVKLAWYQYCSKLDDKSPSRGINQFYTNLFHGTVRHLARAMFDFLHIPMETPPYAFLQKVHMRKLCYLLEAKDVTYFADSVADISHQSWHVGLLREVQLKDLEFGHLDWKEMSPAYADYEKKGTFSLEAWTIHRLEVLIFGGVPKERVAVFRTPLSERSYYLGDFTPYVVPYPE